jgi:N-acetylglucosaminyl-diphospho-decaprenol L-rhamnosyltransferase
MDKDLTIIIVNWNTKGLLRDCLRSIYAHNESDFIEVTVVDNASRDGSEEMVVEEFPDVRMIQSGGNIGFARANNLAIKGTQSTFLLFLNPDTEIRDDSLRLMVEFLKSNPSVGAVGCKMRNADGKLQPLGLQWHPTPLTEMATILCLSERTINTLKPILPYFNPENSGYLKKLYGGCLMVRKEVLEQVGYFDERFFMYAEDVDLCRRIEKSSWKLYYMNDAEIIHLGGGASSQTFNQFSTLTKCESLYKYMEKYYGRLGKHSYKAAVFLASNVRLIALYILEGLQTVKGFGYTGKYKLSTAKYSAMVRWSLNLEKPVVGG